MRMVNHVGGREKHRLKTKKAKPPRRAVSAGDGAAGADGGISKKGSAKGGKDGKKCLAKVATNLRTFFSCLCILALFLRTSSFFLSTDALAVCWA